MPEMSYEELKRAYADLLDRAGWQPIETCPRGRIVLMFAVTDRRDDGTIANWKMATGYFSSVGDDLEWDGSRVNKPYQHRPTHWMPLPEPPQ